MKNLSVKELKVPDTLIWVCNECKNEQDNNWQCTKCGAPTQSFDEKRVAVSEDTPIATYKALGNFMVLDQQVNKGEEVNIKNSYVVKDLLKSGLIEKISDVAPKNKGGRPKKIQE